MGVVEWGATNIGPGHVAQTTRAPIILGRSGPDGQNLGERPGQLADVLAAAAPTVVVDDINGHVWAKLLLNRILKLNFNESTPVFSKVDLDQYISESREDLEDDSDVDTEMFKNALDFANVKVRDCMTPRTDLVSINLQMFPDEEEHVAAYLNETYYKFPAR